MNQHMRMASLMAAVFGIMSMTRPAHAYTEGACKDDMQKLCGDMKPGDGRMMDCMKQHQSDVSQACKDNMAEGKAKFEEKKKELEAACSADIKQFCGSVTPGQGREFACLKSYEDKISAGCKEKLPHRMGKGMHTGMKHDGNDQNDSQNGEPPVPPAGK